jgi:hypothetical protein
VEDLLGNLIYLIPIAVIVFRVISAAAGRGKKKDAAQAHAQAKSARPAQRQETRQWVKEVSGENDRARMRNLNALPHWEREAQTKPPVKKPVQPVRKTIAKPLGGGPVSKPSPTAATASRRPPYVAAAAASAPTPHATTALPQSAAAAKAAQQTVAPVQTAPQAAQPAPGAQPAFGNLPAINRLTGLKAAFAWSEVLGPPLALRE